MADSIINIAGLCSGVGMLDVACGLALDWLGIRHRLALLCEWEAYAAACLLARMEEASLEPCPVWCGDLEQLNCRAFRGMVDLLCAGFPCQPWSCAGKQGGTDDARWLWPGIARAIRDAQPALVFLENVPGLVSGGGLHFVLDDLAEMRFDAEWLHLTAESVGASHRRERVFILAYRPGVQWRAEQRGEPDGVLRSVGNATSERRPPNGEDGPFGSGRLHAHGSDTPTLALPSIGRQRIVRQSPGGDGQPDGGGEDAVGNPGFQGVRGWLHAASVGGVQASVKGEPQQRQRSRGSPSDSDEDLGDSQCPRPQWDGPAIAVRRNIAQPCGTDGRVFAPGPSADWSQIPEHLWPAVEPGFRVLVDGVASSVVCPICHWPALVREWRQGMMYALDQLCGTKEGAAQSATRPAVPDLRNDQREDRRPSSRHRWATAASNLLLPEMSHSFGCDDRKAEEESRETLPQLRKASRREESEKQVLLAPLRDSVQGKEGCEHFSGNAGSLSGVREKEPRADKAGAAVLQPQLRHHLSKFPLDQYRPDQLRCEGNGVVALCAAVAFVELMRRAGIATPPA